MLNPASQLYRYRGKCLDAAAAAAAVDRLMKAVAVEVVSNARSTTSGILP